MMYHGFTMKPESQTTTLILAVLSDGPRHGYAIAREIERLSADALSPGEGILYPALRGLENDSLVVSEWQTFGSGPARKVYTLTEEGRAELARRTKAWDIYAQAVASILGRKPHGSPA
jgi:PadR family transcriptional regulator PadR